MPGSDALFEALPPGQADGYVRAIIVSDVSPDHLFTTLLFHVFAQHENVTPSLRSVEQLFNFLQRHNWGFEKCDIAMSRRPSPSDVELPQKD